MSGWGRGSPRSRGRSFELVTVGAVGLLLAGCGTDFGAPHAATEQGTTTASLWRIFLVGALAVAALIWILVIWSVLRYRRRRGDDGEVPPQRQYNNKMEVLYTVVPIVAVAFLFAITVVATEKVTSTSARPDLTIDVHQIGMALRRLRAFAREGAEEELNLQGTVDATAKNAGELELVMMPPKRPNVRVILMMDVGGSMDPYAYLCSRLFTAAKKANHFKELRCYYFHNCVYGQVYSTEDLEQAIPVNDLLRECDKRYKLIMVGDALMAPFELFREFGAIDYGDRNRLPGIAWLLMLAQHFERSVWINPEPSRYWPNSTIEHIAGVFPMHTFTLDGLGDAMLYLSRSPEKKVK